MSQMRPGKELGREDIIGRKLIDIRSKVELNKKGLDWAHTYYFLDSGAVFDLPLDDAGTFCVAAPKRGCERIKHTHLKFILGQCIEQVLRAGPDADHEFDSPYLQLANGYAVNDIACYYHGVLAIGVYVIPPGDLDLSTLVDFFPKAARKVSKQRRRG